MTNEITIEELMKIKREIKTERKMKIAEEYLRRHKIGPSLSHLETILDLLEKNENKPMVHKNNQFEEWLLNYKG